MSTKETQRSAVLQLPLSGKKPCEMFHLLKSSGVKRRTVYNIVKRYVDTGSINDRKRSGRLRTARTAAMLKGLKARIRRSPRRVQKKLALGLNVSKQTISRALKQDLRLGALKRGT